MTTQAVHANLLSRWPPSSLSCAARRNTFITLHCRCTFQCCPALVAAVQSQLSSLQESHAAQLSSQQEASARQLAQQLKTADAIIKELEGAAVSLQNQLAAEVERADGYSKELQR